MGLSYSKERRRCGGFRYKVTCGANLGERLCEMHTKEDRQMRVCWHNGILRVNGNASGLYESLSDEAALSTLLL
jgi:hypothetical protein